jgi:hypothetical protein
VGQKWVGIARSAEKVSKNLAILLGLGIRLRPPHTVRRRVAGIGILLLLGACVGGESVTPTESPGMAAQTSASPLVATDNVLKQQCQEAADLLAFSVPCPTALPATNSPVRCEIPGAFRDSNITPKKGCALGEGFLLSPTGIQDLELFHLLIEGSLEQGTGCDMDEPHERIQTVHGQGFLLTCTGPGLHEGHILVRFAIGDVTVNISAHGHTEHNEQAVLAIADAIEMVPPR